MCNLGISFIYRAEWQRNSQFRVFFFQARLVTNLWRSREDGDFVFNVCGGTLRAHGCILSAASPVFKAMLSSGMSEGLSNSMSVEADPAELQAMLRFIYLGELDATGQQLPGVLELAHKYEVWVKLEYFKMRLDDFLISKNVLRVLGAMGDHRIRVQKTYGHVWSNLIPVRDASVLPPWYSNIFPCIFGPVSISVKKCHCEDLPDSQSYTAIKFSCSVINLRLI